MTITQSQRILDLLFEGKSLNDVVSAVGVSANAVRGVAKTLNAASTKQRAFDLLAAGHSADDVSDLLGLGANVVQGYANDLTLTSTAQITLGIGHLYAGSGVPNITGSNAGDFYFRQDTPSTANQRIYVATASNTWTAIL